MTADIFPGIIVGLREGLEAFLIISVILEYLNKLKKPEYKKTVFFGVGAGIAGSFVFGLVLWAITVYVSRLGNSVSKIWESAASLVALIFISTFIYWMMVHGRSMVKEVRKSVDTHLSKIGLIVLSSVVVLREGAEIALFAFTAVDKQSYTLGIIIGLVIAAVIAFIVYRSLVKLNLRIIFNITLVYLILQAGYLIGYSIHELLSALKDLSYISTGSLLLTEVYTFKDTILDHKTGVIGIIVNVLIGWYSRPEVIQFVLYTGYIGLNFFLWRRISVKEKTQSTILNAQAEF